MFPARGPGCREDAMGSSENTSGAMPLRVYMQIALATLLWGTAFPYVKKGLEYATPIRFAGMRFTLAGLLLLFFAFLTVSKNNNSSGGVDDGEPSRKALSAKPDWPHVMLIGLLSTGVFYALFFLGMARTSPSSAAVVDGSSPVISSLMAHFVLHNDKLTRRKIAAILLAFAGVISMALAPNRFRGAGISTTGCLLIFSGLVVNSIGTMLVVAYRGTLSLIKLTGCQMTFGGLLLLSMSVFLESHSEWARVADPKFLIICFYLASVSALAFRIWFGLIRRYKITSISVYSSLTAVWGTILSILIMHDKVSPALMLGIVCVGSAVALMNTDRSGHEREVLPVEVAP